MSRHLTYSYAAIDHDIKIVKPEGAVFSYPVLANVSQDIRELVAEKVIQVLDAFVEWLDEPPTDWATLLNLPLAPEGSAHAQAPQEKKPDYAHIVA